MKKAKLLYIIIGIICVVAIGIGVYTQFFAKKDPNKVAKSKGNITNEQVNAQNENVQEPKEIQTKSREEIKEEFEFLFNNKYNFDGTDVTKVEKRVKAEDIIYTVYAKDEETEFYDVDISIPLVNIKGDAPNEFNKNTQDIFIKKANEVLKNKELLKSSIYDVDYVAYLNGEILSIAIKSSLKQGLNPQREMVQTYNYNIITKEKVELKDLLEKKSISEDILKNKIKNTVENAKQEADALEASGYTVYKRELKNDIYKTENINTFFLGKNAKLYVVFAYGNANFTSEMDIIEF